MNWYLQASTRVEMETWMLVLRKACHVRNEAKLRELSATAGLSITSLQVPSYSLTLFSLLFANVVCDRKKRGRWK